MKLSNGASYSFTYEVACKPLDAVLFLRLAHKLCPTAVLDIRLGLVLATAKD